MSLSLSGATASPATAADFVASTGTKAAAGSGDASWASIFPAVEEQQQDSEDSSSPGFPPPPYILSQSAPIEASRTTALLSLSLFSASSTQIAGQETPDVEAGPSPRPAENTAATSSFFYRAVVTVEIAMAVATQPQAVEASADAGAPQAVPVEDAESPTAHAIVTPEVPLEHRPAALATAMQRAARALQNAAGRDGVDTDRTAETANENAATTQAARDGGSPTLKQQHSPQSPQRLAARNEIGLHEKTARGTAGKVPAALNFYNVAAEAAATPPAAAPDASAAANRDTAAPARPAADSGSSKTIDAMLASDVVPKTAGPEAANSEIAFEAEVQLKDAEGAEKIKPTGSEAAPRMVLSRDVPQLARRAAVAGRSESASMRSPSTLAALDSYFGGRSHRIEAKVGEPRSFQAFDDQTGGSLEQAAREIELPTAPVSNVAPQQKVSMEAAPGAKTIAMPVAALLDAAEPVKTHEVAPEARSLALKIQSEDRGTANVILTDRAGQVHVTVRASDPALAQSLRGDLSSLAGGLEQQGFGVKLWQPSSSSGSSANSDSRSNANEYSQQSDGSHSRQRHDSDDAGHRNRRQQEWIEDID